MKEKIKIIEPKTTKIEEKTQKMSVLIAEWVPIVKDRIGVS